jgi:hypothetical protein
LKGTIKNINIQEIEDRLVFKLDFSEEGKEYSNTDVLKLKIHRIFIRAWLHYTEIAGLVQGIKVVVTEEMPDSFLTV